MPYLVNTTAGLPARFRFLASGVVLIGLAPLLLHPEIPVLMRFLTGLATSGIRNVGYVAHLGAYFLATLSILSIYGVARVTMLGMIVSVLLVHGTATELFQFWIPSRDCDPWDLLCNQAGTLSAATVWMIWSSIAGIRPYLPAQTPGNQRSPSISP